MKKSQKIFIGIILLFFILVFTAPKPVEAKTREEIIEEIRVQINIILAKIAEIQYQIDELKKTEGVVAKSIILISPNGSEKWDVGKTYNIKWNTSGYSSDSKVQIKLLDERYNQNLERSELKIVETTNSSIYSWKIPDILNSYPLYGSLYKIAVSIGEGADKKTDNSDSYFIISQAIPIYLDIISPNGGEIIRVGETYTIKWDSLGMENYKLSIILQRSGMNYLTIAERIPNNSYYNWKVNEGLYGSDYKILINFYDNSGNLVTWDLSSYNFTISTP